MATIFSKIVAGEIPSYKCAENDRFYAFLDINPLVKGHTLVIPKREVDYIFDLSDEEIGAMQVFAKHVAAGNQKAFSLHQSRTGRFRTGSTPCAHPLDSHAEREGHAFQQP